VEEFFISMPRLADAHGDREERARPFGGASLLATPVSFFLSFSVIFGFGDLWCCGDELGFTLLI
jgi:hypothetical protein